MAYLFGRYSENVLDALKSDDEFADQFAGGFMDDAESDFLGIGKKAKARRTARKADRAAAKKYKLETERIRALQGQGRSSVIKDIAGGLASVAGSVFAGGQSTFVPDQEASNPALENLQQNRNPQQGQQANYQQMDNQPAAKNNTIIYLVIGAIVIGAAIYFLKKK